MSGRGGTAARFAAAVAVGSFLLFLIQPMVARLALPRLGGAPTVWASAMLAFQLLLLAGYGYAAWLQRWPARRQLAIHAALLILAGLWLPVRLLALQPPLGAAMLLWTPALIIASVGPLFVALAAGAPLLQAWFAAAEPGRDPYPLYAASNLGSMIGLAAYPLLLEPLLGLRAQGWLWAAGYGLAVLLILAAGWRASGVAGARPPSALAEPLAGRRVLRWLALAAVPSALMIAVTTRIATDIAPMPLIWVLPLALYLLSFALAFAGREWRVSRFVRLAAAPLLVLTGGVAPLPGSALPLLALALSLLLLFTVALALHGELYRTRPGAAQLTRFYLWIAAGGALGGGFCAIVAPLLFDWSWELPTLILAAALLLPAQPLIGSDGEWALTGRARSLLLVTATLALVLVIGATVVLAPPQTSFGPFLVGLIAALALLLTGWRLPFALALLLLMTANGGWRAAQASAAGRYQRSWFGIYQVGEDRISRWLAHGTTLHGLELRDAPTRVASYYGPRSGLGQALALTHTAYHDHGRIAVVGLGAGTLACARRPGEALTLYEIDPLMVRIARERFHFLADCAPHAPIRLGDARLTLSAEPGDRFDLIALDAFSSDAVPVHLLTTQALATYARLLSPDGLLLVHISNRFVDLEPQLAALARAGGWAGAIRRDFPDDAAVAAGMLPSRWIALAKRPAVLARLTGPLAPRDQDPRRYAAPVWQPLVDEGVRPWTDDRASILPYVEPLRLIER